MLRKESTVPLCGIIININDESKTQENITVSFEYITCILYQRQSSICCLLRIPCNLHPRIDAYGVRAACFGCVCNAFR